ncbi:hypothetical protein MBLNU459_g3897t2 [Dothideomycetes sp. NU459]
MFPIGWMYYFGTNLDRKFHIPDFWPKQNETHTIPFEREEISEELERLKQRRLAVRARRLEYAGVSEEAASDIQTREKPSAYLKSLQNSSRSSSSSSSTSLAVASQTSDEGAANQAPQPSAHESGKAGKGWFGWLS